MGRSTGLGLAYGACLVKKKKINTLTRQSNPLNPNAQSVRSNPKKTVDFFPIPNHARGPEMSGNTEDPRVITSINV